MSAIVAGVWAALVFALYLHGHAFVPFRPFIYDPGYFSWGVFWAAWGGRLPGLAVFAAWLCVISEWGRAIGGLVLGAGAGKRLSAIAGSRLGIGFGVLGMAVFALGQAGLLFPSVLLVTALVPLIAFRSWKYLRLPTFPAGPLPVSWIILASLPVLAAIPLVLTPEGSWDAMVYHLSFPSYFLMEHKRFPLPDSPFTGYPYLAEMHYVLALGLGGSDLAAKLQHGACWLFSGAAIFSVARTFGRVAGWGSLLVWLGSAMGMQLAGLSYVDHAVAWMGALCAAFIGFTPRLAFLAGIFAGWCVSVKYTGGFALVGLLAALLRPGTLRLLPIAAAGAVLAGGIWPITNIIELGNPMYPFMTRIFGGISSPAVEFWRSSPLGDTGAGGGWLQGLWLRLAHDDGGVGTPFGPLWLAVIIPAIFAGPRDWPRARYFLAALVLWIAIPVTPRFLLPFIPAGLMAAAPAWGSRRLALVLAGSAMVFLPVSLFDKVRASAIQFNAFVAGAGLVSREDYLRLGLQPKPEYWDGAWEVNRNIPKRSRLLLVSGIKAYYFERRAMVSHQHLDPVPLFRLARAAPTAERLAVRLRQLGITHIIYLARALEGGPAKGYSWMDEGAYSRFVDWFRGWTSFEVRLGECLIYSVRHSRVNRPLGRVPVLEQEVIQELSSGGRAGGNPALARLIRLAPDSSAARMARGLAVLTRRGSDPLDALEPLSQAVSNIEASPVSWRALGYVYTKQGSQERAGQCFIEAVSLDPDDAEAHYNLGLVYVRMGRMDAGIAELRRAAMADPGRVDFRLTLERYLVLGAGNR